MRNINVNKIAVENVYLFTGTEEVRGNAKIDQIIQTIPPATFNITKYDLDISPLSEVIIDAITVPFLVDYKIIIVKNPYFITKKKQGKAQDLNNLIKYLKNPSDHTVLIINAIGLEPDSTNEIYQLLQKVAYIKDTQLLDEVEYKGWVIRLFRDEQVTIKDDALELLVELVKQNYVRMEHEVKKLATFVGANGTVTSKDVQNLVSRDLEGEIFNFIKAIVTKDTKKVIELHQAFTNSTQDLMGIIAMISRTFRNLLTTLKLLKAGYKQHDIAQFYNVSDGRAYYMVKDAKMFDETDLVNYVKKMADLDYHIKSGQIEKKIGLERLLYHF